MTGKTGTPGVASGGFINNYNEGSEMTLGQKQRVFAKMIGRLISFAYGEGFELTFGDAYAVSGHMKNSLHYKRLAIDLNLFKNGRYLTKTKDHEPLGLFWEAIGGSWGGRFADGNHYSLEHNNVR